MVAVMLFMFVGGIAFSQVASNPRAVTLQWLRLGGIIAVALLAVVGAVLAKESAEGVVTGGFIAVLVISVAQLTCVQLGQRKAQRVLALLVFGFSAALTWYLAVSMFSVSQADHPLGADGSMVYGRIALSATSAVASALVGGFLMTMLLGHAYLTAGGEMTQAPFRRLVIWMGALLLIRSLLTGVFGIAYLFLKDEGLNNLGIWKSSILFARLFVGLVEIGRAHV